MSHEPKKSESETTSEQLKVLNGRVEELIKKVDSIDAKLGKVEADSKAVLGSTQTLVAQSSTLVTAAAVNRANEIMVNNISDPSGFLAHEMSDYLFNYLEKYQSTEFRRWLATRGKGVVEKTIQSFVNSKIPQLKWYGVSITKIDDKKYHQSAKTSFPIELNTGVPVIGKIAVAKCILNVEGDCDVEKKDFTNVKAKFETEQPQKAVFSSFVDDLNQSIKPHKTAYGILAPMGRGLNRGWAWLKRETSFSITFAAVFLITLMLWPAMPPAIQPYLALRGPYLYYWFLGFSTFSLVLGLINGLVYGLVVWVLFKFKIIDKLPMLRKLRINKPGGLQIDIRRLVVALIAIAIIIAVLVGLYYFLQPQPIDTAAVRAYADPMAENILVGFNEHNYTMVSLNFDQNMLNTFNQAYFEALWSNVSTKVGNYSAKTYYKIVPESGFLAVYYNTTFTSETGYVDVKVLYGGSGTTHYVTGFAIDSPKLRS